MSYVLTAYLVDLGDLKSVFGSKDQSMIRAIEPVIEETYDDDQDEADAQRAAVQALVMGEALDPGKAAQYQCALWDICREKGEELLPDAWGGIRWDSVEACGLEELLTKTGPPVPLPPHQDIPFVGHVRHENIAQYIEAAEDQKAKADPNVGDLLDEYIGWLEMAQSKNRDIVFFYG
jgi:hypothetical protein